MPFFKRDLYWSLLGTNKNRQPSTSGQQGMGALNMVDGLVVNAIIYHIDKNVKSVILG